MSQLKRTNKSPIKTKWKTHISILLVWAIQFAELFSLSSTECFHAGPKETKKQVKKKRKKEKKFVLLVPNRFGVNSPSVTCLAFMNQQNSFGFPCQSVRLHAQLSGATTIAWLGHLIGLLGLLFPLHKCWGKSNNWQKVYPILQS